MSLRTNFKCDCSYLSSVSLMVAVEKQALFYIYFFVKLVTDAKDICVIWLNTITFRNEKKLIYKSTNCSHQVA